MEEVMMSIPAPDATTTMEDEKVVAGDDSIPNEEELTTNNPQTIAMSAPNIEDDVNVANNPNPIPDSPVAEQPTLQNLQRQLDQSLTLTTEYKDQLHALNEAIHLLSLLLQPHPESRNDSSSSDLSTTNITVSIHRRLDELHSAWKLEETSLPTLITSLSRLQSNYRHVSNEADVSSHENRLLREALKQSLRNNQTMEENVRTLSNENRELKVQLKQKSKEKKSILKCMKEHVTTMQRREKREEELQIADMLQLHERILSGNTTNGGNNNHNNHQYCGKEVEEDEESVVSSVSSISTASLVTEDGIPTIRYAFSEEGGWGATSFLPSEDDLDQSPTTPVAPAPPPPSRVYKLTFPRGKKIGLQFQKVPLHSSDTSSDDTFESSSSSEEETTSDDAFLICGYRGFDSTLNTQPPLGSRLIRVDDEEDLETNHMSFDEVKAIIHKKMSAGVAFTMTFRHDSLNERQSDIVRKAVEAARERDDLVSSQTMMPTERRNSCGRIESVQDSNPVEEEHQEMVDKMKGAETMDKMKGAFTFKGMGKNKMDLSRFKLFSS